MRSLPARFWRATRGYRWMALVLLLYTLLDACFAGLSEGRGVLTPGETDVGLVALACLVLGMRLLVLFVVPLAVTWRLLSQLSFWVARRIGSGGPEGPDSSQQ